MPKPTAVWGIDIGQCALKALKLELGEGGVPVAAAFDYIEHAKILSQPDADPDALTREALEKFLSRNRLGNDLVAIGVPGQSGLARFVKLPPVEEKKIPDIVKFEAKQQIPFPLEEVVWDYQKIAGGEVVENFAMETEVGLFAMKREMISRYLGQFNAVKIECGIVQMAPLALTNYATYEVLGRGGVDPVDPLAAPPEDTPKGKKRCAVVLDVGTDGSNLIITDAGKVIWQRPIPLGGNNFTRALTKEMKLTFAKAEHLKRNAAKSPDLANILKALRPVLQDFVGEVQRSLGYFTNTHRDAHVAFMVGLGSAFKLPGLQKYMAEKLSLDVRKPASFDRLTGDQVKNDPVFAENVLTFPIAYGLALQGLNLLGDRNDYGRLRTNLLPQEIRTERLIRAKKPYAAAAAAALLLGTGGLALGYATQFGAVTDPGIKKARDAAKSQVDAAKSQQAQEAAAKGEIDKLQTDVKAVVAGNDERLTFARLYEVVNIALPRAGQDGNLKDGDAQQRLWSTTEGLKALTKAKQRIRAGIPADRVADEDLSNDLAHVQVESVYCQHTENLKGFVEAADKFANDTYGAEIARYLAESEKEADPANQNRMKAKGPDGAGWVFQISGYTYHGGKTDFLARSVVKNFQKANLYADQSAVFVDPATGRPVLDKDGKPLEKVTKYLNGVPDPVKGGVSHVFLLVARPVNEPVGTSAFQYLNRNYIAQLVPPPGGDAAAAAPPPGVGESGSGGPGMMGAAPAGWQPLFAPGAGGSGSTAGPAASGGGPPAAGGSSGGTGSGPAMSRGGDGPPSAAPPPPAGTGPGVAPAGTVAGEKVQKVRSEFVLVFLWKEPAAAAAGAEKK